MASVGWAIPAPTNVRVADVPNDDMGRGLQITWTYEPDPSGPPLKGFQILRRPVDGAEMVPITPAPLGPDTRSYEDAGAAPPKKPDSELREKATTYIYVVRAVYSEPDVPEPVYADSTESNPMAARGNWFHTGQIPVLLVALFLGGVLVWLTQRARRGYLPKIRRIAGLEAVEEAIGRATEMGRPILYVTGIGGVSAIATIASINIFSHVTKKAGEYGTRILAPNSDPIVMQVLRTVAEQAYLDIGRPDNYNAEDVFFLTESQFAFAAAVNGIMVRERPAAIFLQGVFYAESLILAETGNSVGAIQIAGTDRDAQLPFFIAACDYTLIGEELFAASAYLSEDAQLLSTIRAQDVGKAFLMAAMIVGVLLQQFGIDWIARFFESVQ